MGAEQRIALASLGAARFGFTVLVEKSGRKAVPRVRSPKRRRVHSNVPCKPEFAVATADVLAIVVVYERSLDEVACWGRLSSILVAKRSVAPTRLRLAHVLIYDNSFVAHDRAAAEHTACTYVHDPQNGGTAAAYRLGAELATARGDTWLLLLDQDTNIPENMFESASHSLSLARDPSPLALLPWVVHGETAVSPARMTPLGSIRPLDRHTPVNPAWRLTGIASGCFIRVCAFNALGSIPKDLWLDYVDHWLLLRLAGRPASVAIIDCVMNHHLSVFDPGLLSISRLQNILRAESSFVSGLPWLARTMHPLRLVVRAIRIAAARPGQAIVVLRHAVGLRGGLRS